MAADSQNMLGGWKTAYSLPKLFRLKDGSVCGVCGDYAAAVTFKNWLDSDRSADRPSLADTTVIQMSANELLVHESGGTFPIVASFGAWGSGAPPAYGALYMGADAVRAVEVAALVDDCTGGAVTCMALIVADE